MGRHETRPAGAPPDHVEDTTCCARGSSRDANADAGGISSTHGDDAFNGKKSAPVSLTVRSTSDKTSTSAGKDAGAENVDDRSWRRATAGFYSQSSWECLLDGCARDVGPG